MKNALIIFARNPVMGKVKTRLAEKLGEKKAYDIYIMLLGNIYKKTKDLNYEKYLFLSEDFDENLFDSGYKQVIQKGADLGEKMYNAIETALNEGMENVILIGTDIPDLDPKIFDEAFDKMSFDDIVIGPAKDGGYYLIGVKVPMKFLFENMKWSNENVLKNTIERIKREKKSYYLLKELNDIDTEEDLK